MSLKITRVQLNGYPTTEQYEHLHSRLKPLGFDRSIISSQGKRFHLPHGEYVSDNLLSTDEVCDLATKAADAVYPGSVSVMTTEGNSIRWNGLQPA